MKVALDVSAMPERLAGAGRYVVELTRRLPDYGVDPTLVTRRHDAARWRALSPSSKLSSVVPDGRGARLLYEAWSLGSGDAARTTEVWHGPHYTMPHRGDLRAVVTIHDLTFFTDPAWHERTKVAFFRRSITYASRHARVLICVSDFTSRQLDLLLPDHAPVVVAPHGVDLERFSRSDTGDRDVFASRNLDFDVPYIVFVGTIEPRKGLDVLLDAFADVARADADVELWIAGQDGWGMDAFDALVQAHPASRRIRRLGFVDDELLPALLRQSRAVAYPSRGEGFGLPVLEAMACGALVVTSADTVMAEVAGDGATLTKVGDSVALAHALVETLDLDVAVRASKAEVARRRAETFTWAQSMDRHVAAYEQARGTLT